MNAPSRAALRLASVVVVVGLSANGPSAFGQSFGVELFNTLMPASGGMGGTSIAQPQDALSAMHGNPAALSQFEGTRFEFSGAWAEPTVHIDQTGQIPAVGPAIISPFSSTSDTPGSAVGNIGVAQDFRALGCPATAGLFFATDAGVGTDYRSVPESNGTTNELFIISLGGAVGVELTDTISLGGSLSMGSAFLDGPFVGNSAMVPAYGLRGTVGVDWQAFDATKLGFYYQSPEHFIFDDAIALRQPGGGFDKFRNINMDLPQNIGLGIANTSLMDGKLLLAADVLYILWDDADLFRTVYQNEWVMQLGAQYTRGKCRLRVGYVYAANPMNPNPGISAGGITPPGGFRAIDYLQAQFAVPNRNRFTAGAGITDLLPGLDFDLFAGGMFHEGDDFGQFTHVNVASFWIGAGFTWRFGRGSECCGWQY
jgi:long-chain fatty acid transport protein